MERSPTPALYAACQRYGARQRYRERDVGCCRLLHGVSWEGQGVPPADPYLLGRFSTPQTTISWRARVAKRHATRRGLRGEPPAPPSVASAKTTREHEDGERV